MSRRSPSSRTSRSPAVRPARIRTYAQSLVTLSRRWTSRIPARWNRSRAQAAQVSASRYRPRPASATASPWALRTCSSGRPPRSASSTASRSTSTAQPWSASSKHNPYWYAVWGVRAAWQARSASSSERSTGANTPAYSARSSGASCAARWDSTSARISDSRPRRTAHASRQKSTVSSCRAAPGSLESTVQRRRCCPRSW